MLGHSSGHFLRKEVFARDQYGRPCKFEPLWLARQRKKKLKHTQR